MRSLHSGWLDSPTPPSTHELWQHRSVLSPNAGLPDSLTLHEHSRPALSQLPGGTPYTKLLSLLLPRGFLVSISLPCNAQLSQKPGIPICICLLSSLRSPFSWSSTTLGPNQKEAPGRKPEPLWGLSRFFTQESESWAVDA